jgi:hypothetical protein
MRDDCRVYPHDRPVLKSDPPPPIIKPSTNTHLPKGVSFSSGPSVASSTPTSTSTSTSTSSPPSSSTVFVSFVLFPAKIRWPLTRSYLGHFLRHLQGHLHPIHRRCRLWACWPRNVCLHGPISHQMEEKTCSLPEGRHTPGPQIVDPVNFI